MTWKPATGRSHAKASTGYDHRLPGAEKLVLCALASALANLRADLLALRRLEEHRRASLRACCGVTSIVVRLLLLAYRRLRAEHECPQEYVFRPLVLHFSMLTTCTALHSLVRAVSILPEPRALRRFRDCVELFREILLRKMNALIV